MDETMDETWIHHYIPEFKRSSPHHHHGYVSPITICCSRKFRNQRSSYLVKLPRPRSAHQRVPRENSSSSLEPGEIRRKAPTRNPRQLMPTPLTTMSPNRFAALIDAMHADEAEEETTTDPDPVPTAPVKTIKPSPIFAPDGSYIKGFITDDALAIENLRFDGSVRVYVEDKASFIKLKEYLNANEIHYQTFQARDERAYRIAVKGLHYNTEIDEIKEALAAHGYIVRGCEIKNAISRTNKKPMSLFFVNLELSSCNKDMFAIKRLYRCVVTIEPPLKSKEVLQCYRCQDTPRSTAGCGDDHHSNECTKPKELPACCALCKGIPPASYKGCKVYQKVKEQHTPKPRPMVPPTSRAAPTVTPGLSHASALRGAQQPQQQSEPVPSAPSQTNTRLDRLEVMMEKMMDQVAALTHLLTSLMAKQCN
ncbi:hypothetical protein ACLKA7_001000 [Drosophila subpalustris]